MWEMPIIDWEADHDRLTRQVDQTLKRINDTLKEYEAWNERNGSTGSNSSASSSQLSLDGSEGAKHDL